MDINKRIEEYFRTLPSERDFSSMAKHIKSIDSALEVLRWSRTYGIREGFDSAINILCDAPDVIIPTIESNEVTNEEELQVLILSLSFCTLNIELKFNTLKSLIPLHKGRLVKNTIIDGFLGLLDVMTSSDLITTDILIKEIQDNYLCANEQDEYIRNLAQRAVRELREYVCVI